MRFLIGTLPGPPEVSTARALPGLLLLFFLFSLGACAGGEVRQRGLELSDVVVTEPVTGERAALDLTVRDVTGEGDALLGLDAPGVGRAGLHRTEGEATGGRMTMTAVDSLVVPAGGELRLRPGGAHGMFEDLDEEAGATWAAGDSVPLTLRFRRAGEVEVVALVVGYAELDGIFPVGGGG